MSRYEVSFWGNKNVLKLLHNYEYTKNNLIVYFKLVNWVVCELYHNKAVIFLKID